MNDAAVLADPMTGRIVDVNEPAERLWLRPREDLIGAPQVSLHPPDLEDDPNARETFRRHIRALQAGNRAVIQMPILRKDGSRVAVEISSSLFEVDGTQYILGLFRDITERQPKKAPTPVKLVKPEPKEDVRPNGSTSSGACVSVTLNSSSLRGLRRSGALPRASVTRSTTP